MRRFSLLHGKDHLQGALGLCLVYGLHAAADRHDRRDHAVDQLAHARIALQRRERRRERSTPCPYRMNCHVAIQQPALSRITFLQRRERRRNGPHHVGENTQTA